MPLNTTDESLKPAIMVVDDNRTFSNMIAMVLKTAAPGFRVVRAYTLAGAIEMANTPDIQIFIIDVHLSDGTGLDFLGRIRASHPKARAIIMTSSPEADHRDMAQQFGAVHFLAKPIHLKRFADLIHTLVNGNEDALGLASIAAVEVLDMQSLALNDALIEIRGSGRRSGWVTLQSGRVLDAGTGSETAENALRRIAEWKDVRFEVKPLPEKVSRRIDRPWREFREQTIAHLEPGLG